MQWKVPNPALNRSSRNLLKVLDLLLGIVPEVYDRICPDTCKYLMVIRISYVSYYELLLLKGHLVPLNQREGALRAKSQLSRLLLNVEDHI